MATFTVDTHLFRELGERLVGRDSTALVELIKNAYDADATEVVVYGEGLSLQEAGLVRITDNGVGMTRAEFENGFLRIASRAKEVGERRSLRFQRRYTGAKGIGRLAAHKLASVVQIESFPWQRPSSSETLGVEAMIDWDLIEKCETLDEVDGTLGVVVDDIPGNGHRRSGTTITLRRLRKRWTSREHGRFLEEVQGFEVPSWLTSQLPRTIVKEELLFDRPMVREVGDADGFSFRVKLEGDLAPAEDYWTTALAAANWIIEIDADESTKTVRYAIAPTMRTREELPEAKVVQYSLDHPSPAAGPFFHARILVRTGPLRESHAVRTWMGNATGVRVFMEGFRVLPYGEPRNDWLALDRDTAERGRGFLSRADSDPLSAVLGATEAVEEEGLLVIPNKHYFGAVFLTERRARGLRLLVNREGFVPDANYNTLYLLVRGGIDLATRVRAAATVDKRTERRTRRSKRSQQTASPDYMPTALTVRAAVGEAQALAEEAKRLISKGDFRSAEPKVSSALALVAEVAELSNDLVREGAMLRVLASVGTQLAAFVHEINGLLGMAQALENAVGRLRRTLKLKPEERRTLAEFGKAAGDLRLNLERQASYLVDVVTPDARRRRVRQSFAERFDSGARLVASAADRSGITIQNGIPRELRSPPIFPAELTTVFANLLTNAVKAAGAKGRVRGSGSKGREGGATLRIENTGIRVKLAEAERWFRPFESSTTKVDPILGQGMGLGLTITRAILEEYGATIQFVEPTRDYATSVEVAFPG